MIQYPEKQWDEIKICKGNKALARQKSKVLVFRNILVPSIGTVHKIVIVT